MPVAEEADLQGHQVVRVRRCRLDVRERHLPPPGLRALQEDKVVRAGKPRLEAPVPATPAAAGAGEQVAPYRAEEAAEEGDAEESGPAEVQVDEFPAQAAAIHRQAAAKQQQEEEEEGARPSLAMKEIGGRWWVWEFFS